MGCGSAHKPFRASRASFSSLSSTVSPGAYLRYHQHQPSHYPLTAEGRERWCPELIVPRLVRRAGCNFIAPGSYLFLVIKFEMCSHGPEIMRRRLQRHLDLIKRLGDSLSLVDDRSLLHLPPPNLCTPDPQIIGDTFTKTGKGVSLQIGL